jgi:hypothetical protein
MAYKFQLGAAVLSGSLTQEGDITGEGNLTVANSGEIGCAADPDLITLANQSVAFANNADVNIAKTAGLQLGGVAVSATAAQLNQLNSGEVSSVTEIFATDLKLGEDDQTKIDFGTADRIEFYANNNLKAQLFGNVFTPGANDGTSLGSAAIGWSELYLADSSEIKFGDDQDVQLIHAPDSGLILQTKQSSNTGVNLKMRHSSSSPDDNDIIGAFEFAGYDDAGNETTFAGFSSKVTDVSNGAEDAGIQLDVMVGGTLVPGILDLGVTATGVVTIKDGAYDFDVASHDGTNGLKLGGAIVTSTAAELNKLDGATADVTAAKLSTLSALSNDEIGYLDGATKGESSANKVVVLDAQGDFEMQDNDKIKFGNGADASIYWDGDSLEIGTESSATPINIGHGTSEVTIGDNLTVAGNLTVQGTTTTVDSTTINVSSSFTFEGTADDHETTLHAGGDGVGGTPTTDLTIYLPSFSASAGTQAFYLPVMIDAPTDASSKVTAAEFALLDGGSTVGTDSLASGDGFLHNDGGQMKQTSVDKIADLFAGDGLAASSGVMALSIAGLASELSSASVADTDEFAISDGGSMKKIDFQHVRDSVFADVSDQASIAAGGALTLNVAAITGQTDFTGVLENTDELIFSDGGVLKKMDMSIVKTYIGSGTSNVASGSNSATLEVGVNYFGVHGGAISATLPASAGLTVGESVKIKAGSDCSTTNTLTINKAGSQTIDGATAIVLESPFAAVELVYVVADTWRVF